MSIQSDPEVRSILALENFAVSHKLTGTEAVQLFHKHQVFEKILLQHKSPHQLDFTETIQYVEKIIGREACKLTLYHGSNIAFDQISLSNSRNHRDFGRGFYCTILQDQSDEWAKRLYMRNFSGRQYVYQYIFCPSEELNIKHFTALDKDWLEFVKENRVKGGIQHSYDVVIGPVTDYQTMGTVQLYTSGNLKTDEAVDKFYNNKFSKQVSFHTERAIKHLYFQRRMEV